MRRYKLAAVLTIILVAVAASAVRAAPDMQSTLDGPVLNIGHRGASAYAPEHTFAAYDLALEQGADYIEIDLQMTAEGVLEHFSKRMNLSEQEALSIQPLATTELRADGSSCIRGHLFCTAL